MNLIQSIEAGLKNGAKFVGFTYTSKKHNETARYTMLLGANYLKACEADLLELELLARDAKGIEAIVIAKQIESLRESIAAKNEGRFHRDYKKPNLYRQVVPGVQIATNDLTCEVWGFEHARKILIPGVYKRVNSSPETLVKARIRRGLKTGKFKSLCLDLGNMHSARINGETIELY